MKASYTLSRPVLATGTSSKVDLLVSFRGDASQSPARRGLNLSLVIDRSGSMAGAPLKHALQASRNLVERMGPEDWLSIVGYDDSPTTFLPPTRVQDRAAIGAVLSKVHAAGCTNLTGGWQQGLTHVKVNQARERLNRVLLLTDGQANVGITDPKQILAKVKEASGAGVATTTLGFGSSFNEDLLIGMAGAGEGHFYFIQSPDEAEGVFGIEMEGLSSVAAQNLVVTIQPAPTVKVSSVLNRYRFEARGQAVEVGLGEVYTTEDRQLAVELSVDAGATPGSAPLLTLAYKYQTLVDGVLKEFSGELPVTVTLGSEEEASALSADKNVLAQTNRLRIAQVKDRAVELADQGDFKGATQQLRNTIAELSANIDKSSFDIVEEVEQLEHYAKRLESKRFDAVIRKEMRDQSYQAGTRSRNDLALRGTAGGSADELEAVSTAPEGAIIVKCEREGGKLRVHAVSAGYDPTFNIQFPRSIREEGVSYVVEKLEPSADGTFYRAQGTIKRLVLPGQERGARASGGGARKTGKASKVTGSAQDLPTTNAVGTGVLVQCVKEGSKLRARVVSDGYDPNLNMRFPRDIREEGILYVVDEVITASGGASYIACGDIKRLVQ